MDSSSTQHNLSSNKQPPEKVHFALSAMESSPTALKDDANAEKVQVAGESRKRNSAGGMDDSVVKKRMALNAEDGDASNNNFTVVNSVETATLEERMKKLERMYQRACRTTREAEIRAERAEKIIESMKATGAAGINVSENQAVVKQEIAVASNDNPPNDNSVEMASLQEKVKKLERMFEGACRSAREAELRAERAEKIIDSKRGIKEDADKKDKEIEELRKKEANLKRNNDNLHREMADMRRTMHSLNCHSCEGIISREAGLLQENHAMRRDLDHMRRLMSNGCYNCGLPPHLRDSKLRQDNESMKKEISDLKKRLEPMMKCQNCGVLQSRILALEGKDSELNKNDDKEDENIVEDLHIQVNEQGNEKGKKRRRGNRRPIKGPQMSLDEIMTGLSELSNAFPSKTVEENDADLAEGATKSYDFDAIWTPITTSEDSISADTAGELLRYKYLKECNRSAFIQKLPSNPVQCCGAIVLRPNLVFHLCSWFHRKQVKSAGKGVSKAALAQWIKAMEDSRTEDPPVEGEEASTVAMEESGTAEDDELLGIEPMEENGTAKDATIDVQEASTVEAMEESGTAEDATVEDTVAQASETRGGQITPTPTGLLPTPPNGFLSWLYSGWKETAREGKKKWEMVKNQTGLQIKKDPVNEGEPSKKEIQTEHQSKKELMAESEEVERKEEEEKRKENEKKMDEGSGVKEHSRDKPNGQDCQRSDSCLNGPIEVVTLE